MPSPVFFTNTTTQKKEPLKPSVAGKVSFYSCGPTVYNHIHIGNLRSALVADTTYRMLKRAGYEVDYVRNYTDVDDRIIAQSIAQKRPSIEVSEHWIKEVERDYALALMDEPKHKTKVTDHIPEIIAMTEAILKNGKAYVVDGEVFFSVSDFPNYGCLSGHKPEETEAGIRVAVRSQKKNPLDFSLWKPAKPGEPAWDSPWGRGRPGWHIECSAMASKWLGEQIDLHHGGIDLTFPHHENEIAQSEAASGKAPFVKIWIHHAFVNLSKEKMSKSLGNVFSARDFLALYGGEVARMMLLSAHYRSPIEFGDELIDQALTGLERIYEAKAKAESLLSLKVAVPDLRAESAWSEFVATAQKASQDMSAAYFNDLNMPEVLAALFVLIREWNRVVTGPRAEGTPSAVLGAQALIQVIEQDLGGVFGVGRRPSAAALAEFQKIRAQRQSALQSSLGKQAITPEQIEALLEARKQARLSKNFAESDRIRNELDAAGVAIKDSPAGTTWSFK